MCSAWPADTPEVIWTASPLPLAVRLMEFGGASGEDLAVAVRVPLIVTLCASARPQGKRASTPNTRQRIPRRENVCIEFINASVLYVLRIGKSIQLTSCPLAVDAVSR